jgi:hypothetical protein
MPTLAEQLEAATSKLDALLATPAAATAPTETVQQMTPQEAMLHITDELSKGVSKERAEYLKSVVSEIAKNNFESNGEGAISIKMVNDPMQIKPGTAPIAPIQSLSSATPESNFADNMSAVQKVALIVKMLTNPAELKERIAKSALTDKMDQIKSMFGLKEADMEDTYDVRWKIGDLIGVLQNAIKLEQFVNGGNDSTAKTATTPEAQPPVPPPSSLGKAEKEAPANAVWPRDMAAAKFDPVKKAYEPDKNVWSE